MVVISAFVALNCGGNSTSGPCEEFLADYEEFADEYIAYMRKEKSNPNDISLISASATMMEKAATFRERANEAVCKGNNEARARVAKIQAKVAAAIQ